jgi:hypothetical protein
MGVTPTLGRRLTATSGIRSPGRFHRANVVSARGSNCRRAAFTEPRHATLDDGTVRFHRATCYGFGLHPGRQALRMTLPESQLSQRCAGPPLVSNRRHLPEITGTVSWRLYVNSRPCEIKSLIQLAFTVANDTLACSMLSQSQACHLGR